MTKYQAESLHRILSDESQLDAFIALLDAEKVDIQESGNPWTSGILDGLRDSITKEAKLVFVEHIKDALRHYAQGEDVK